MSNLLKRVITDFDSIDATRLGWLVLATAELSQNRYALLRYSAAQKEWRVSVRFGHRDKCGCGNCPALVEHIATSRDSPVEAYSRAVQWLTAVHTRAGIGSNLAHVAKVLDQVGDKSADPYPPLHEYMLKR